MRLYLNKIETKIIKEALEDLYFSCNGDRADICDTLLKRIIICELLQQSEKKSRTDEP